MAETLNWVSGSKSIDVVSANPIPMCAQEWISFIQDLESFNSAVPLKKLEFTQTAPTVFDYKIKAQPNRNWNQTLTFDNTLDPLQTFNVPDGFRLSEFKHQRSVRDCLVALNNKFSISSISCKW